MVAATPAGKQMLWDRLQDPSLRSHCIPGVSWRIFAWKLPGYPAHPPPLQGQALQHVDGAASNPGLMAERLLCHPEGYFVSALS